MAQFFDIDGSVLEGGGQILRMAISLSALMCTPVRVSNIRAGRAKPGLAAQHLKGIELVGAMCGAKVNGAHIGSMQIEFAPGPLRGGSYTADTQTAGSVSLLVQVALPCALFCPAPVQLDLYGGTNADMAPQIDYITEVFRPNLERLGASFDMELHRRGYYPRGGGHVTISARPVRSLNPVSATERGQVDKILGWSFVAGTLPIKLAHEMSAGARDRLRRTFGDVAANIECYKEDQRVAPHNCSGIILVCETRGGCVLGGSALGRRGMESRDVGKMAADELCSAYESGACMDTHTQDQLIIYMALAEGTSTIRVGEVTLHTKTAIHIAELLTKCKFTVCASGDGHVITCSGVGLRNAHLS